MRKNLKAARNAKGMTQQAVADYLDINTRAYQGIEYGKTLGSITHWDKLEDFFGIPQRQLREITPNEVIKRDIKDIGESY